jgi:hypothetical protein
MILRRGGGEMRNRETEAAPAKIGGGNAAGVALGRFPTLSDVNTITTTMKREYSTSGLCVCGSSLSYFSLMLQYLDII